MVPAPLIEVMLERCTAAAVLFPSFLFE